MLQQLTEFEGLSQLVSRFSDAMRARLWEKLEQGYEGWADDSRREEVIENVRSKLTASVTKYSQGESKQLVDIANLAAILWLHECLDQQSAPYPTKRDPYLEAYQGSLVNDETGDPNS
jgi:hypothetical protein